MSQKLCPEYPPVPSPPGEVLQFHPSRRLTTAMSYRLAFTTAAREALPLISTPPLAHSAPSAAVCPSHSSWLLSCA